MSTTTSTKRRPAVDWSPVPSGPVSATALAALGLAAVSSVGDLADLPAYWGAATAAVGATGSVLTGAHRNLPGNALLYRLGSWLGAGGWLTWTLADAGPWHADTLAGLTLGAVGAGVLAPLASRTRPVHQPGTGLVPVTTPASVRSTEGWEARIWRVCRVRVRVPQVTPWASGAGYDVLVQLPLGGVTADHLERHTEALATDARLDYGCGIQVTPGRRRGEVVLRVATVNMLERTVAHPGDFSARSVYDPAGWGLYADSAHTEAILRELSMVVAGRKGSGKTTLLQDLCIALGRCEDNLLWQIDLNGGGITQPWIDVWLDGRVARCPVDWAAPCVSEARKMVAAGIRIAKHRKASYRHLKRAHDDNLLPLSADLPQVTIVVDEGGSAVKDTKLEALLDELNNIGRNEGVNLVISSLRPTADLIPTNMVKQCGVKIQMHGNERDLHLAFDDYRLSLADLSGKGTGFVSIDEGAPVPFRAWNNAPSTVERAAMAIANLRPELDEASAAEAGTDYATRYERMRKAFTEGPSSIQEPDEDPYGLSAWSTPAPVPAPAASPRPALSVVTDADAWADPDQITTPAPAGVAHDSTAWGDPAALPAPAPVGELPAGPAPLDTSGVPDILIAALAAFEAARDDRMHSEDLAAALNLSGGPHELAARMEPYEVKPRPKFSRKGQNRRGYWRADIEAAARAIAAGHTPPTLNPGADDTDEQAS